MKIQTILLSVLIAGGGAAAAAGLARSSTEALGLDLESGTYVEARDATVWGGACHVSAESAGGASAVMGWSFDAADVRVAAALEGTGNLQAHDVFGVGEPADRRVELWVDAPSDEAAKAAVERVRSLSDLGALIAVHRAPVTLFRDGDRFELVVEDALALKGEARADRSCCTMPESRWYHTLSVTTDSIVGVPSECRFEGTDALSPWGFEERNSAYVARFGS